MSASGSPGSDVPHVDVDPFDMNFFADPYPTHELLRETGPLAGALGWAYAATLGVALVYLGEHYVVDLAAGLALAEGVRAATPVAAPAAARLSRLVQALETKARDV